MDVFQALSSTPYASLYKTRYPTGSGRPGHVQARVGAPGPTVQPSVIFSKSHREGKKCFLPNAATMAPRCLHRAVKYIASAPTSLLQAVARQNAQ